MSCEAATEIPPSKNHLSDLITLCTHSSNSNPIVRITE